MEDRDPAEEPGSVGGVDPETLAARQKADFWDLVYKPGTSGANPHVFFTNFAAASAQEGSLDAIQHEPCQVHCAGGTNCQCAYSECGQPGCGAGCCQCCGQGECDSCIDGAPAGLLTCHVGSASYSETYVNSHSHIKGHARVINGAYAINVMSYRGDWENHPYFLSDSQIHLVRKYLRWDVPTTEDIDYITAGRNTGYTWVAAGRRPMLGSFAFRNPLSKLDFNGDGRRDIGVWIPPTSAGSAGRVKVLLSPSFSQTPGTFIDTDFGRLGDIPIPADYNTDGKTDFAVYQPGGGANRADPTNAQAYWRWCPTSATAASTNCGGISQTTCAGIPSYCFAYGLRQTTPTPGLEFDGSLPNEFSVYDDATGKWFWQAQGGAYNWRYIGSAQKGSVPLPGHYDSDFLSDLVLWDPVDGIYHWLRSQQGWNTAGWKTYGPNYVSTAYGGAGARGGGLPMPLFRPVTICSPACLPYKRLTFSIWRPYEGDWSTVWDPFGTGTIDTACIFGLNRVDQPISGFDRNADNRADYGIYRATTYGASAEIHMKNALAAACNGAYALRTCSTCAIGTRAVPVADMTGDGKEEMILIHGDPMTIEWRTSESDYATAGGSWAVGDTLALFL